MFILQKVQPSFAQPTNKSSRIFCLLEHPDYLSYRLSYLSYHCTTCKSEFSTLVLKNNEPSFLLILVYMGSYFHLGE